MSKWHISGRFNSKGEFNGTISPSSTSNNSFDLEIFTDDPLECLLRLGINGVLAVISFLITWWLFSTDIPFGNVLLIGFIPIIVLLVCGIGAIINLLNLLWLFIVYIAVYIALFFTKLLEIDEDGDAKKNNRKKLIRLEALTGISVLLFFLFLFLSPNSSLCGILALVFLCLAADFFVLEIIFLVKFLWFVWKTKKRK